VGGRGAGGTTRRLGITALIVLAAMPGMANAQHSNLSLESIGPAGGNDAIPADVVGSLDAGGRVFMTTSEPLTAADTDSSFDLYSRTGATTTLLSTGTAGGNGAYPANYGAAGATGTRVLFQTDERMVSADTDSSLDVYLREGSTTTLVSTGTESDANGPFDSLFAAASADGARVFFVTRGALLPSDTDASLDIYEHSGGTTALVSTGPAGGNGSPGADLMGVSDDGTKAFFHTTESLIATDTDSVQDVYQRANGATTLLSVGPDGGNGPNAAAYDASSLDGSKVFFHTDESLLASDTDARPDVYARSGDTTTIHSVGPSGGNSTAVVGLVGISQDGSKVFLETTGRLIPSPVDRDSHNDVYQSAGGTMTMVSPGGNDTVATAAYFAGASADGDRVFIRSEEALASGDTDQYQDIFEFYGEGTLTRLSLGPAGGNAPMHASFGGISEGGDRVFFETYESLDAGDTDANLDVYERSGGATTLLSAGPGGGNGIFDAGFRAVSADGGRVFFRTAESLVAADTDSVADIYSANLPGTVNVVLDSIPDDAEDFSFTAGGGLSPASFELDDDSDGTLSNTHSFGNLAPGSGYSVSQALPTGWSLVSATCDDGSPVSDIDLAEGETVTCTFVVQRGYVRPNAATPVHVSLVPAYTQCSSPNGTHGPALEFPSCSPPVLSSAHLTVGEHDANGLPVNMLGSAKLQAVAGNPSTPADEADVAITFNVTDVRRGSSLGDYAGELQVAVTLRVTDRLSGAAEDEVGTVSDLPFNVTVPCAVTDDDTIGSTCSVETSADAVLPGMVSESKRTIWEMSDVHVFDGGPDGRASTPGNTLFLRQGLFVP
jgi:hypothetical protein